jgi:hypothetical protein
MGESHVEVLIDTGLSTSLFQASRSEVKVGRESTAQHVAFLHGHRSTQIVSHANQCKQGVRVPSAIIAL